MATCYRHPNRETGVSCSNCGNPICPDCMTPTPVGMRCPDCSKQKTHGRTLQSMAVEPIATYVLVAINVAIWFGAARAPADTYEQLVLWGPFVHEGEYWRLITSGFLHTETWHILLNGLALFWLGRMIEPALGHARFVGDLLRLAAVRVAGRDDPLAGHAHPGRVRRGLRPAGRRDRDGPQPQHRPDPVGAGADPGAEPRAHVLSRTACRWAATSAA